MRLLRQIPKINNFAVIGKYLITSSKEDVKIFLENSFELEKHLLFKRFPKILHADEKAIFLQEQTNLLRIDYTFKEHKLFDINIHNTWMIHYLNDNEILVKQAVDRDKNYFQLIKYDLNERNVFWEYPCDNYKYWFFDIKYLIVDNNNSKNIQSIKIETGICDWVIDINSIFENLYPYDEGICEIAVKPKVYKNILIVETQKTESGVRYLVGIDINSGKLKWHHRGFNNIELYNGKLYNIEFLGLFRIVNPDTGEIEYEIDLKEEFEKMNINCEHRFNVTDSHIYFKHAIEGKFGILNLDTFKIEGVYQLPEGNTMSTDEYPVISGNKLYVRSAPQNNLFIYE